MTAKIIATVVVALGGLAYLIFGMGDKDQALFVEVHDVLANPAKWEGKNLDVHGFAVPGSIKEEIVGQVTKREFDLELCGKRLHVRHAGAKPDTFKEQAETVVKGKLVRQDGQLVVLAVEGDQGIVAKCPSKYDGNRQAPKCD